MVYGTVGAWMGGFDSLRAPRFGYLARRNIGGLRMGHGRWVSATAFGILYVVRKNVSRSVMMPRDAQTFLVVGISRHFW